MPYDDDDSEISLSSQTESVHKARRESLKQKLRKEGLARRAQALADLHTLKLEVLKDQVSSKKEKDTKSATRDQLKPLASATKTREQEIASQKLSADTKQSSDRLVQEGKKADDVEKQLKKSEVQGEDA